MATKAAREIYDFESRYVFPGEVVSPASAAALVTQIYTELDLSAPPQVTTRARSRRVSHYDPAVDVIRLAKSPGQWVTSVLLHEVAHALVDRLFFEHDHENDPHGPLFRRVLFELLDRYGQNTMSSLEDYARQEKLVVRRDLVLAPRFGRKRNFRLRRRAKK